MAKTETLKKGDVVQWYSPKDNDGKPTGVEMVLEVERVDSEAEQVYLNIVEQSFSGPDLNTRTRKKTGSKTLSLEDALGRKRRHEAINKPKSHSRRYTQPDETFSFGVDSEEAAEAAAKHWGYIRKKRIEQLRVDLKESKKVKDATGIVNALTELAKYQRLTGPERRDLARAMQQEELAALAR